MAVVGLTGGIGSGKSVVAGWLRDAGVPVIDADQLAREAVAPGTPALASIARTFGEHLIGDDGALDRAALGKIVFSDPKKLAMLNTITHPAILARAGDQMVALMTDGHPWVVYEAALILENGLAPGLRSLVAVVCDPEAQIDRVMARDGLSREEAGARLSAQTDNKARREAADFALENDGDLNALEIQVEALVATLSQAYGAPLSAASI
jgi:dephospho-CoA kinase